MPAFSANLSPTAFSSWPLRGRHEWEGQLALAFGVLLSMLFSTTGSAVASERSLFRVLGLPFGVLCLWQALYPSKLMRARPMQWLADRSFSIYLLHPIVIEVLRRGYEYLRNHGIPDEGWLYFTCLAMGLCGLLVAAHITYRFVELPGIAAGRRIAARSITGKGIPSPVASWARASKCR
jgi:peptidoglycan/LPS O-acetylase OafA/YrhL